MPDPRRNIIHIPVALEPQEAYEDACALARAWAAFSRELAGSGRVCTHPPAVRQLIEGQYICADCGRTVAPPPPEADRG